LILESKDKKYRLIFLILFIVGGSVYAIIQGAKGGDFKIYLGAAELLSQGDSCYNVWIHLGGDNYCGYSYSPIFATFLIPFSYLPSPTVEILWSFANLFFLYRLFILFSGYLPLSKLSSREYRFWAFVSAALIARFVLHNFEMVQMTLFLLYCCFEAMHQLKKENYLLASLLIALGIVVKIIPIVLIPYLLYRKQFKPLLYTIVITVIFILSPALIYGWDMNISLLSEWMDIINPNNTEFTTGQNINGEGVHSISGFIAAYFTDSESRFNLDYSRTIYLIDQENFIILVNVIRLFLIAFTLYFLRTLPFKSSKNKLHTFWQLCYIFTIAPLIFPHQQKYAFLFLAPAVLYTVYYLIITSREQILPKPKFFIAFSSLFLFFALASLTTDGLIGDHLNELSEYYKTITLGTFFLIVALAVCNPLFLRETSEGN